MGVMVIEAKSNMWGLLGVQLDLFANKGIGELPAPEEQQPQPEQQVQQAEQQAQPENQQPEQQQAQQQQQQAQQPERRRRGRR